MQIERESRMGVRALALACTAAVVATGAISSTAQAQPRTVTVFVFNFGYSTVRPSESPDPIDPIINVGDTIRWQWIGGTHDVISIPDQAETFASPLRSTGFTFSHTFNTPGTYQYYCSLHGGFIPGFAYGMAGRVIVVPTPAAAGVMLLGGMVAMRRRR